MLEKTNIIKEKKLNKYTMYNIINAKNTKKNIIKKKKNGDKIRINIQKNSHY